MFGALDISTSGLTAQRVRLNTVAANIANANSTRDASGALRPYRRQVPLFAEAMDRAGRPRGVQVTEIAHDPSEFRKVYDPGHPDAVDGYVSYPNVDMATEYVNALEATRAYEANITAIEATKAMLSASLRLLA
ncbi:MAG: Flagellar basal-body rod protein FlgC [Phycisphaerae bacterium]|nr:Flagellar basal-body rod protein FlgC [Phycisphaerae bacterium]